MLNLLPVMIALSLGFVANPARAAGPSSVDFSRDVLPILSDKCFTCHGPDASARKADLRLDLKESALRVKDPVIVAGKSDQSDLYSRITSDVADEVMPPKKSGRSLTKDQIETLKKWIDSGASWGKHWAFETVKRPGEPTVKDGTWSRNPIDRFVLAKLEARSIGHEAIARSRQGNLDTSGFARLNGFTTQLE
jgi:mono/diheme cytochrome c family protein